MLEDWVAGSDLAPRTRGGAGGRPPSRPSRLLESEPERAMRHDRPGRAHMASGEKLYEGKAKIVYSTDDPDVYIQDFKDSATAFDGKKKGTIGDKGHVNNQISARLFQMLEEGGVKTHFLGLGVRHGHAHPPARHVPGGVRRAQHRRRLALEAHRLPRGHGAQEPAHRRVLLQGRRAGRPAALHGPPGGTRGGHAPGSGRGDGGRQADQHPAGRLLRARAACCWSTSSWSSAATPTGCSGWATRSRPTPAACGTPRRARSSTRTGSAAIWAG